MGGPPRDLTGHRQGYLTVLAYHHSDDRNRYWSVQCICGKQIVRRTSVLTDGRAKSCGCRFKDGANRARFGNNSSLKHGLSDTRTYRSWAGMMTRCYNENCERREYYAGCNITVHERWHTFENFLADMGERPPGTSIDRINPYGNYEPGNCRWATPKQQAENRRPRGFRKNNLQP
jgi:hypothetical protein